MTPTGQKYPSVTSVVSLHSAGAIQAWRQRVGEAEANKISKKASRRGTSFHTLCENYITSGQADPSLVDAEMFSSVKPILNDIDNVHCLEQSLFSHRLQVAGTTDCIAEYQGQLCIIDFKSSLKPKRREWVHGYFMQAAAYSLMFWELTGILVSKIMIIVGVDNEKPQIFIESITPWLDEFIQLRRQYKQLKGV